MNLIKEKEKFIADFFKNESNVKEYNKKFEEVLNLVIRKDIANKIMKTYIEDKIKDKVELLKEQIRKEKEFKLQKEKEEKELLKQQKEFLKEQKKILAEEEKKQKELKLKKEKEDFLKLKEIESKLNKEKVKELTSIDKVLKIESIEELYKALELMQKEYFIINRNGKVYVLSDKNNNLVFTEIQSFHTFFKYLNFTDTVDKYKKQTIYLSNLFLEDGHTKRINQIIFDPKLSYGYQNGKFNVWKGFKYEPIEGNVYPFLKLLEVNCDKDIESFEYFLNYLAFCIQKPHKNPMTAIAIMGDQGSGKGTLINNTICALTDNSKHIDNINQLVGEFNGHLTDAFFVCLDEASFGGDIKEANRLKTFISENTRTINDKGKTAFTIDSYTKTFILSNNDYIVNIEQTDRRYVILKASNELKGNFKWFENYQKWLNGGGLNYIMHYLLERDINSFNPLQIPNTRSKIDLQLKSADLPTKFLYDLLADNIDYQADMYCEEQKRIYRNKMYEEFVSYCKKYHPKNYISTVNEFNKVIIKAFDYDKKANWRQNWKDKKGYYFEIFSISDCQEMFALNLFKTTPENIFYNHKAHIEKEEKEAELVF